MLPLKKADGSAELLAFFYLHRGKSARRRTDPSAAAGAAALLYGSVLLPAPAADALYGQRQAGSARSAAVGTAAGSAGRRQERIQTRPQSGRKPGTAAFPAGAAGLPRRRRPRFRIGLCSQAARRMLPGQSRTGIWAERTSCCKFGSQVLGSGDLLPDRSFFEQGGSSLAALNVLSRYFNKGYALTLTQFYAHPTAREQAALLTGTLARSPGPASLQKPQRSRPQQLGRWERCCSPGATGILGAHLLAALLQGRRAESDLPAAGRKRRAAVADTVR